MRSQDFIGAVVSGRRTKPGCCSSIYFDGKHVYSYGTHYPLLINVNGRWVLNTRGYSRTTSKHMGWASRFADYSFSVPYGGRGDLSPQSLYEQVTKRLEALPAEYARLRKSAFRKRETLDRERGQLLALRNFLYTQIFYPETI